MMAASRPSVSWTFSRQVAESSADQTSRRSICGWGPCTVTPAVVKSRLIPSVVLVPRSVSPASATPGSCIPSGGSSVIPTVINISFAAGGMCRTGIVCPPVQLHLTTPGGRRQEVGTHPAR